MKKIIASIFITLFAFQFSFAQNLEVSFTAADDQSYVQLDSILVMNRTQGDSSMHYWPDTSLAIAVTPGDLMLYVGYATDPGVGVGSINEQGGFKVCQPYPNPASRESVVTFTIPKEGTVHVTAVDLQGHNVAAAVLQLEKGTHSVRFVQGTIPFYLFTVQWQDQLQTVKVINTGMCQDKRFRIEYMGHGTVSLPFKGSEALTEALFIESGILDSPSGNKSYTFQFATNIPCPGTPTVDYEGQTYNTIQVFSQCWLKENLNVGTMISGDDDMADNGSIEKYCHNNEPDSCAKYGGLYQWNEMMQYTTQQGTQGICPPDWHLPTDEEWKVLEGAVDSLYGIGDPEWDLWDSNGYDAGTKLRTKSGWYDWGDGPNGTDLFGFSGLPGGYRIKTGGFLPPGSGGNWWTSAESNISGKWSRTLIFDTPTTFRDISYKQAGFSVRCLRDY